MHEEWTEQERRQYQRALTWGEEQLLPPPVRQAFSTWFARNGAAMFDKIERAWTWWAAERHDLLDE